MKKQLDGKQHEVVSAVEDFFEDHDKSFFTTGIQGLQHRWKKCMDRRGDYMLKNKQHVDKFDHCIIVSLWTFQPILVMARLIANK